MQPLDFAKFRRHTVYVTGQTGTFGPYLEAALRRAGLSNRAAARRSGVTDVMIGAYINEKSRPTTPTLTALVRTLGLNPEEAFGKAGLPLPADLVAIRAGAAELTNAELLSLLKDRLFATGTSPALPTVELTDAQVRWRGRLIVRLETVADEAREIGDDSAAQVLCDMAETFKANLEAATAAEISEAQAQRQPANGE